MTMIDLPKAIMRSESDCPMVDAGEGVKLQLLQVDIELGLWVIRNLFEPGARVQTHKHTGQVFAFTQSGCWKYDEYPELMTAGTYLFEPAGSIHTLIVPETNTEVTDVWFAIYGANLNLDAEGNVESVLDAGFILEAYLALCEAEGYDRPNVIGA
ncbi:MAG TPA: 2,4'-dihydroxyacetophenone dioxygenase family protein [Acidimicrobiales bacterium]|nr:2,4'-dihydroxyacetophenone dioxygenase family protein [Acidimicrobiales bacterium]